jgi:hypothetical protein
LDDGTEARLLDVIQVGVRARRPAVHQPENWVINEKPWSLIARPMAKSLVPVLQDAIVDGPELLNGSSDRVSYASLQEQNATASLALVAPKKLQLYRQSSFTGKPQARGRFSLGKGSEACVYDLVVTDPEWRSRIIQQGPQDLIQTTAKFVVTISVGEPFGLYCYKLIAAIIPLPSSLAKAF